MFVGRLKWTVGHAIDGDILASFRFALRVATPVHTENCVGERDTWLLGLRWQERNTDDQMENCCVDAV